LTLIIIGSYKVSGILALLFDKEEPSNLVKYGHFMSYYDYFSSNILNLFLGQGLGMSFFSTGFNRLVLTTELTYFEVLRVWGLPITFIFLSILILPIVKEIKSKSISPLFIAYIAYLFIAGTNPFLLDSTGMLVLVYVFSRMFLDPKGSGIRKNT
jgi:hypothetical protein